MKLSPFLVIFFLSLSSQHQLGFAQNTHAGYLKSVTEFLREFFDWWNDASSDLNGRSTPEPEQQLPASFLQLFFQLLQSTVASDSDDYQTETRPKATLKSCPKTTCDNSHVIGCGVPNRQGRIVNGTDADPHEYPWMVAIYRKRTFLFDLGKPFRFVCGGTLINEKYVISAAHCFFDRMLRRFVSEGFIKVRVGDHHRLDLDLPEMETWIAKLIIHPGFVRATFNNDIALLKLGDKVKLSEYIRPVCLPLKQVNYSNRTGNVIGWGRSEYLSKSQPNILQELQVPIWDNESCVTNTKYKDKEITHNMFCAGFVEGQRDSCVGDSGGSLTVEESDGIFIQIGIVSWGKRCASAGYPGVYAKVANYIDWIAENTQDSCYCMP